MLFSLRIISSPSTTSRAKQLTLFTSKRSIFFCRQSLSIFSLVSSQGYGANRIAMYLNERNILPRTANAHWHASSIRAILRNPIYIGIMRMGACCSERSFAQYRIISDEQYEAVQKIMLERSLSHTLTRSIPYRTDNAYLLTGLLRCGSCGSRLCGATMSSKGASTQCHRR